METMLLQLLRDILLLNIMLLFYLKNNDYLKMSIQIMREARASQEFVSHSHGFYKKKHGGQYNITINRKRITSQDGFKKH